MNSHTLSPQTINLKKNSRGRHKISPSNKNNLQINLIGST